MAKKPAKRSELPTKYEAGFLRTLDRRTDVYQRLNAAYEAIVADAGGLDSLSHARRSLIERFVFLEAVLETWEAQIVSSDPKDSAELLSRWVQALNSLQGLARTIGLDRKAKRTPSLKAYVEERA